MIGGIATTIGRVAGLSLPRGILLPAETDESLANSTLTPDHSTESSTVAGKLETDDEIAAFFERDYNERGDGGWSDNEGEEIKVHNDALEATREEQGLRDEGNDLDAEDEGVPSTRIPGAPGGWLPPAPPDTWGGYVPKFNAPVSFSDVDNPGGWSEYTFQPVYKDHKYQGHFTPSAAKVVPANANGEREIDGWTFHYAGYTCDAFDEATYTRGDAKRGDTITSTKRCVTT